MSRIVQTQRHLQDCDPRSLQECRMEYISCSALTQYIEKTPSESSDGVLFVFQINRKVESDSATTTTSDQTTETEEGQGSGCGNDIDVDGAIGEALCSGNANGGHANLRVREL